MSSRCCLRCRAVIVIAKAVQQPLCGAALSSKYPVSAEKAPRRLMQGRQLMNRRLFGDVYDKTIAGFLPYSAGSTNQVLVIVKLTVMSVSTWLSVHFIG